MNTRNDKIIRMMGSAVFGIATLTATAGALSLTAALARIGPRVGDIITFDTPRNVSSAPGARLLVDRVGGFACVLDLGTISRRGGSLVVEARLPSESHAFFLHWAGERTSSDAADCGTAADLVVDQRDIDILASAGGGYGTERKMSPIITSSMAF